MIGVAYIWSISSLIHGCMDVPFNRCRDCFLAHQTDNAFFLRSVLEKNQSRNSLDPEALCDGGTVVHVELEHSQSTGVFLSAFFDDWRQRPARSTPFCPEIHQHRCL